MKQEFQTTLQVSSSRVFIAIPFDPQLVWGTKQRHYVSGTINGMAFRGSLGSDGTSYFLPVGEAWRRDCGVNPGDILTVILEPEGPQQEALAQDIADALASEPDAAQFFHSLATFYRKNYIRWIESAKKTETRLARIAEMMTLLQAGKKQR